jgi:hypothetical protein
VGGGGPLNVKHHIIYCFLDIIIKLEEEARQLEEDRKRAAEEKKVLLHVNVRILSIEISSFPAAEARSRPARFGRKKTPRC